MKLAIKITIRWSGLPIKTGLIGPFWVSRKMYRILLNDKEFSIDAWHEEQVEKLNTPEYIRSKINISSLKLFGHNHFKETK